MAHVEFQNFCNSLQYGYLKSWKAASMLDTIIKMDDATNGEFTNPGSPRLEKYVENCLMMEGFSSQNCAIISKYIRDHVSKWRG